MCHVICTINCHCACCVIAETNYRIMNIIGVKTLKMKKMESTYMFCRIFSLCLKARSHVEIQLSSTVEIRGTLSVVTCGRGLSPMF